MDAALGLRNFHFSHLHSNCRSIRSQPSPLPPNLPISHFLREIDILNGFNLFHKNAFWLCESLEFTYGCLIDKVAILELRMWDWLFVANRIVDLIFVLDMVKCFFTSYQETKLRSSSTWVKDWRKICRHYVYGWFLIDIISIIPYDFLVTTTKFIIASKH